jgi:NADH:ubiquinone oxidoreductase subunit 5 (subunit L)/multisubunit Na+/H+ antiporter MnhA subunit
VLFGFLTDAWGIDSAYRSLILQPVKLMALGVSVLIDQFAIDGAVNGAGGLARSAGRRVRRMADGSIATYGLWMGAVAVVLVFLWSLGGTR